MKWIDFVKGGTNLEEYLVKEYGSRGKFMIETHENRMPIALDDKFRVQRSVGDMVFGQFIITERAITGGHSYHEAMFKLSLAILRPLDDKVFDNTDIDKETFNTESIKEQNARDVLEACKEFFVERNKFVYEDFSGVFYKSDKESEVEETDEEKENTKNEEVFEDRFNRDWYWHTIVDSLAGERFIDHKEIYMSEMRDVAPHLAYLRMKGIIEYKKHKAEEMANRLKNS